jgi:hypothetical protein
LYHNNRYLSATVSAGLLLAKYKWWWKPWMKLRQKCLTIRSLLI